MGAMARMEIKLTELTSLDSLVSGIILHGRMYQASRPLILRFCAGLTINSLMFQLSHVKRPLWKSSFVIFCCGIRRDEEKMTQNINVVGKTG